MTDTSLAALLEVRGDGRHAARRLMKGAKIDPLLYLHPRNLLPHWPPAQQSLGFLAEFVATSHIHAIKAQIITCKRPCSAFSD